MLDQFVYLWINYLPASIRFRKPLMTLANNLDPDEVPQNFRPHLKPKLFDTQIIYQQKFEIETMYFSPGLREKSSWSKVPNVIGSNNSHLAKFSVMQWSKHNISRIKVSILCVLGLHFTSLFLMVLVIYSVCVPGQHIRKSEQNCFHNNSLISQQNPMM